MNAVATFLQSQHQVTN